VQVSLKNFQSIERSRLECSGITCIVGSNNSGKTAHIRSLRALVLNQSGDDFVRAGAESFFVGLRFDASDGKQQEIVYAREDSPFYRINGETYKKVNRRSLNEVTGRSDFLVMDIGGAKVLPQFVFQGQEAFPFSLSEGGVYEVFAEFLGVEGLEELLRERKKAIADKRALCDKQGIECELLSDAVDKKAADIKRYPPEAELVRLQTEFASTFESLRKHIKARDISTDLCTTKATEEHRKKCLEDITSKYQDLSENLALYKGTEERLLALRKIKSSIQDYKGALAKNEVLFKACSSVDISSGNVVKLKVSREYQTCFVSLEKASRALKHFPDSISILKSISVLSLAREYRKTLSNLVAAKQELTATSTRLQELIEKSNFCPTCGQPWPAK